MASCCSEYVPTSLAHGNDWSQNDRLHCSACRKYCDSLNGQAIESQPLFAVARLEGLLRAGLTGVRTLDIGDQLIDSQSLLLFVEDVTWALMQPLLGSPFRALHSLQTLQFRVPMGFNTPVQSDSWLSCAPLAIRRSLLAVLASLILPAAVCGTLISQGGRGRDFWKSMKWLHGAENRRELLDRALFWSPDLAEAVEFY
jgi:hypothetical protein